MFKKIFHIAQKIITTLNYRQVRFKKEGKNCILRSWRSKFIYPTNIELGSNIHVGPYAYFDGAGGIKIGKGVIMAPKVTIYTRTHNFNSLDLEALPFDNRMLTAPVEIKDYVWIGSEVIILPGVTIEDGSVIGAGAVVTKDVPYCAVVAGNPAKIINYRNKEKFEELRGESEPFIFEKFGRRKINVSYKKKEKT